MNICARKSAKTTEKSKQSTPRKIKIVPSRKQVIDESTDPKY